MLKAYGHRLEDDAEVEAHILLRRRRLKVMAQGKHLYHKVMGHGA